MITDAEAKIEEYESEISSLTSEIASKETQVAEANKIREEEHADFVTTERDILTTIDELSRGQVTIKKEMSLLQVEGRQPLFAAKNLKALENVMNKIVNAEWMDVGSKKRLTKFLQSESAQGDSDELSLKAQMVQPQAKVDQYESHSGGILETLVDMQEKAEASLSEARKKEMKGAHATEMTVMSLTDSISLLKQKLADATARKASSAEEMGKAKGEVAGMAKSLAADKEYLTSLHTECQEKSSEWDERKESAHGELEAIAKAKEILSSGVKAAFVQELTARPFGESNRKVAKRGRLSGLLRDLAKKFHSYALMEMASRAKLDPFAKVKGLIEDMVSKLLNEANEEATHKSFCDEEISKNSKSKEEKMMKMDDFQSRMDKASTAVGELNEQVKVMQAEIADIDAAQRESAKVRKEEKENYLIASSAFKESAEAVEQAIQVLTNYYEGASLVQVRTATVTADKQPTFGGSKQDAGNSIISVLEVAEGDFTKMLAEAETAENQAVASFRKLADEDELAKQAKLASVKGRQSEIKSLEVALNHYSDDHATANKEFDAVMDYLVKLKPECETKVMSDEERKARREAEIEGLKEALAILDGESIALVEKRTNLRRVRRA